MPQGDQKITGSQLIITALLREQVEIIFGYPGGAIAPVYDALYDCQNKIRHILVRHEQGAGHAAEGYARITGKVGVVLVTSGPGVTNLITAIANAMMDSVPIICIAGQVNKSMLGTNAFQEVNAISITKTITKWSYQITSATEILSVFARAFHISRTGRPGPVLIDITKNAQLELCNIDCLQELIANSYHIEPPINLQAIEAAAKLLNNARYPLMIIGNGIVIAQAQQQLKDFLAKANIPVAATLHGVSILPIDHDLYVGMIGMHGSYGANILTNQADVILAVGVRFDDRVTGNLAFYAKQAKIIHIDIDASAINKHAQADVAIVADAKLALLLLIGHVKRHKDKHWLGKFRKYDQQEYQKVIQPALCPNKGMILAGEVIYNLSQKTKGRAIIVSGVGQHQMMVAKYYNFHNSNSYLASGGLGTMTYALPAAIGAKLASPVTEVIAVIGDGSFQMSMQELATIAQEQLVIKIIVINNGSLGMVRQWQELFFHKRYSCTTLKNPDFVAVAKAYGIKGRKIRLRKCLDMGLEELLAAQSSYLLEIYTKYEEDIFPMVSGDAPIDHVWLEANQAQP